MKVKLLRRLRKEAKKKVFVRVDDIGYAKVYIFNHQLLYSVSDSYNSYAYKEIEEKLIYYRRKYIMDTLEPMKIKRMVKRLNSKI